ncbi:hypothetical protein [Paracidovorax konjaci]|uniref:hypothetical protein n=1 Tax=Paracidovorax konjaci TaxID=32040 RepID=UPI001113C05A|nr:hypothetical protein [Paracidovorax konjaci]
MDNSGKTLYGHRKCLIHMEKQPDACFLGNRRAPAMRLSRPALDNHVDNPGQALYGSGKSLIHKDLSPGACQLSSGQPAGPAANLLPN